MSIFGWVYWFVHSLDVEISPDKSPYASSELMVSMAIDIDSHEWNKEQLWEMKQPIR